MSNAVWKQEQNQIAWTLDYAASTIPLEMVMKRLGFQYGVWSAEQALSNEREPDIMEAQAMFGVDLYDLMDEYRDEIAQGMAAGIEHESERWNND